MEGAAKQEHIVLLSEELAVIGSAPKLASHHADTPLHLAFSCYLFNSSGQLLLTQRAASKKVWPDVWTNSVCGHPAPEETTPDAIRRRCAYEIGIKRVDQLVECLPDFRYRTPPYNGIIENEFCPVYAARIDAEPVLNPEEVQACRWVSIAELEQAVADNPDIYSYWMKQQLSLLIATAPFQKFYTKSFYTAS